MYNLNRYGGTPTRGSEMADYPVQYETSLLLENGSQVKLRPIRREDVPTWLAFVSRLGAHTKYLRFHHVVKDIGMDDARHYCTVDYNDTFAFVAEILRQSNLDIIAVGRYSRTGKSPVAEFALVVEDAYHGQGIGTWIMESLAKAARDNGITTFEGDILAENHEMMAVLKDHGYEVDVELEAGVYHVRFPITG